MKRPPGYTVMVHRDGSLKSREFQVPVWAVRSSGIALGVAAVLLLVGLASYGPIVAAAARAPLLERRVERLAEENRRIDQLAAALDEAESRYALLRGMLGADMGTPSARDSSRTSSAPDERLYVAPPFAARAPAAGGATPAAAEAGPSVPHLWPLSVSSYATRGVVGAGSRSEEHPGVDLAVPVGSDVRATGGGVVARIGNDESYGLFVLIQHPGGYQSLYGHLSRVVAARNEMVSAGQVIAVSGNSGRSTAPHLHFEIRLGGRSVDPLTLVREGRE